MAFEIDPDIRRASTLPAEVYRDPAIHRRQVDRLFPRTWHVVARDEEVAERGRCVPFTLLPGCLDEPLVLTRDDEGARCLSNVCTHRGNLVVNAPCTQQTLRCRYHGRRFSLDGRFAHMPEFEGVADFPSKRDDLPRIPLESFGPLLFCALDPHASLAECMAPLRERLAGLPLDRARFDPKTSRDYTVDANWALYCDNYLEGFHVPFVHPGLTETLDYGSYTTETFPHGSLQVGIAKEGEPAFELPREHRDFGRRVAGYYYWLFPCTMINAYPWGLSVNVVRPMSVDRTLVAFWSFVWDASKREKGAGADLHRVELEDEEVVCAVQRGVRSRLYQRGRYSPTREAGVHHFHRLLAPYLGG